MFDLNSCALCHLSCAFVQFYYRDPLTEEATDAWKRPALAYQVGRKLASLSFVRPDSPAHSTTEDSWPGSQDNPFWAADDANFRTGSLAAAAEYWNDVLLPASALPAREQRKIHGWIRDGVDVDTFVKPFKGEYEGIKFDHAAPPDYAARNMPVAPEHVLFVRDTIADYVRSGAVVRVQKKPHMLHPIGVAAHPTTGKLRLILDARALNLFTPSDDMKYETLRMFQQGIGTEDVLFSIDHKSGYHHVGLQRSSWKYFGFQWERALYVFTVLPFGWAPACFIYNTLSSVVAAYFRTFGIHCIFYLDDFGFTIVWYMSRWQGAELVWCVVAVMYLAGYYVSRLKCRLSPKPQIELLGFIVDAKAQRFVVPEHKISAILDMVDALTPGAQVDLKSLQSLVGKIQALSLAAPPVSIFLQASYDLLKVFDNRAPTRRRTLVTMSAEAVTDLQELRVLRSWNRLSSWHQERHYRLETDASDLGWGAVFFGADRLDVAGRFSDVQLHQPIHVKEAWAVQYALEHFQDVIPPRCYLDVFVDNVVVQHVLLRGSSPSAVMRQLARTILAWQLERSVIIRLDRISTRANYYADGLSRGKSIPVEGAGEQRLRPELFVQLQRVIGFQCTIDVCAAEANTQLPRFVSRVPCRNAGCVAVDIFECSIPPGDVLYCFPPWILLSALWTHFRQQRWRGVILFPKQPTKPWYGVLTRDAQRIGVLAVKGDRNVLLAAPVFVQSAGPLPWDLCYACFDFRVPPDVSRL